MGEIKEEKIVISQTDELKFKKNHHAWIAEEFNNEDEGGSEQEGGGAGQISISSEQFEAFLFASVLKQIRQGEKIFGPVPYSEDPNHLLGKKNKPNNYPTERPSAHPLLTWSQQFSGDDPKLTALPFENSEAQEKYPELRMKNRLRKKATLQKIKSVSLGR